MSRTRPFSSARGVLLALPALLLLPLAVPRPAHAQCMLANPSFELPGSAGSVFNGWNQFGSVGSTTTATHGAVAARVSGPSTGGWDVSGYWQNQDTVPGQRWKATVCAWHTAVRPLAGQNQAILNIEWRNSAGNLISYESHPVLTAATPVGVTQAYSVISGPAPAGTVSTHLLLGALQSPTDPVPDVYFDQATFESQGPPTLDSLQWSDFPGGKTLTFGGQTWRVKGPGYYGPGPNNFSDNVNNVWVDANGRMHLTIKQSSGIWYSTEVALANALGYGDYIFTTLGRLDTLQPTSVLGLFIWEYGPCYAPANEWWNPYNEIDIEYSRWGAPANDVGQFVAQPYWYSGNIHRFPITFSNNEITSHAFRWLPDRVEFRSWRGGPNDEATSVLINSWTYTGPHIPRPDQPRVHLNLWQCCGTPTVTQEVVMDKFTFVSACPGPHCPGQSAVPPAGFVTRFSMARPNPFARATSIRYTLREAGPARIEVFDLAGRLVRTLVSEDAAAGEHEVEWDGRDAAGSRVASGIYLYRFRAGTVVETQRIALLK